MRMVLCAVALTLMLGGCTYLSSLGVYKLDINQGNYVTQDQVDKLKVGQTRQQVRIALGTPLLTDAFHANRWDYVPASGPDARASPIHRLFRRRPACTLGGR